MSAPPTNTAASLLPASPAGCPSAARSTPSSELRPDRQSLRMVCFASRQPRLAALVDCRPPRGLLMLARPAIRGRPALDALLVGAAANLQRWFRWPGSDCP